jgi:hypothetical protein
MGHPMLLLPGIGGSHLGLVMADLNGVVPSSITCLNAPCADVKQAEDNERGNPSTFYRR